MSTSFPSMKGRALLALLQREPLAYQVVRRHGSHRVMRSRHDYPNIVLGFHDGVTVGGAMVRKVLVRDVGLSESDALWLLRTGGLP